MNTPDRWIVVKINVEKPFYKVFATWLGGYLDGDSWRMNSGISNVEEDGDFLNFYGASGSCYRCRKGSYGTSSYTGGIISKPVEDGNITVLGKDTDFLTLEYTV